MTTFFADRGIISINGIVLGNAKSVKLTVDESVTVVDTMSANKRSAGFKQGNRKVSGSFDLEIPDQKAQIDLAFLWGNDVSLTARFGSNSESHRVIGLVQSSADLNASVGDTGKTINFQAIDAINENGSSVNAQIGF